MKGVKVKMDEDVKLGAEDGTGVEANMGAELTEWAKRPDLVQRSNGGRCRTWVKSCRGVDA